MATRRSTVRTEAGWLRMFAFISVMLMGLGIAVGVVLGKINGNFIGVGNWIKNIAIAIGLIVPLFYSYYEARRHSVVWFVLWIIAVILIVVFYIWGLLPW